jgi:hypothetical protein
MSTGISVSSTCYGINFLVFKVEKYILLLNLISDNVVMSRAKLKFSLKHFCKRQGITCKIWSNTYSFTWNFFMVNVFGDDCNFWFLLLFFFFEFKFEYNIFLFKRTIFLLFSFFLIRLFYFEWAKDLSSVIHIQESSQVKLSSITQNHIL